MKEAKAVLQNQAYFKKVKKLKPNLSFQNEPELSLTLFWQKKGERSVKRKYGDETSFQVMLYIRMMMMRYVDSDVNDIGLPSICFQ